MVLDSQVIPEVNFNQKSQCSELEIVDLAEIHRRAEQLMPPPNTPHRVRFNMLVLIERGTGYHIVDFSRIPFKPGSVVFINKGQVQAFDFSSQPSGKAILYTETFIDSLQATMRIPFLINLAVLEPHIHIEGTLKHSVSRLLDELQTEMGQVESDVAIVKSLFGALLMLLARARNNPAKNLRRVDAQKLTSFLALVAQQYTHSRDASFYANTLGMTYKTLNLLCKKTTGSTAKHHIDQYVLLEAKRRLMIEQYDIATLAYELGFDEATNFTKFFKRHTGQTPKQFR